MTGLLGVIEARWSAWAVTFDDEPDHGLRDPVVRVAWDRRVRSWLPDGASDVADPDTERLRAALPWTGGVMTDERQTVVAVRD